jgi:hypothetical protein
MRPIVKIILVGMLSFSLLEIMRLDTDDLSWWVLGIIFCFGGNLFLDKLFD